MDSFSEAHRVLLGVPRFVSTAGWVVGILLRLPRGG